MPGDGELQPPVGYDERWLVLAALALAAVAAYYVAVLWWFRERGPRPRSVLGDRESCLARLDDIEAEVSSGALTPRQGHQQVSRAVREYVDAATRTLSDLRADGPPEVAALVALTYPPSFAADDQVAAARFDEIVVRARRLVGEVT
jgi:hypothetical protein